jgi:hypothetical protein
MDGVILSLFIPDMGRYYTSPEFIIGWPEFVPPPNDPRFLLWLLGAGILACLVLLALIILLA